MVRVNVIRIVGAWCTINTVYHKIDLYCSHFWIDDLERIYQATPYF